MIIENNKNLWEEMWRKEKAKVKFIGTVSSKRESFGKSKWKNKCLKPNPIQPINGH